MIPKNNFNLNKNIPKKIINIIQEYDNFNLPLNNTFFFNNMPMNKNPYNNI